MPHSFTNLLTHVIFSTKERAPFIDTELKPPLLAYMGGIVREMHATALIINGTADHVHLLIGLPPTPSLSDCMRILKTNSSRWVHEKWSAHSTFGWQSGFGAFSVSQSNVAAVSEYIAHQEEHHRKVSFQEEFLTFLKKHGIEYDERYIWQ
jgi:REP element-mobilizing transposase RayT